MLWAVAQVAALAAGPAGPPTPVPVLLHANRYTDACPSSAQPRLPRGGPDGFLSLRTGPGTAWSETARLRPSDRMFECDERNGWTAVVVEPADGVGDCRIPAPRRGTERYPGPCRHGWVSSRLIVTVAG
jgi:hypothetical protein